MSNLLEEVNNGIAEFKNGAKPAEQPELTIVEPDAPEPFTAILRGLKQLAANGRPFTDADPKKAISQALSCADYPISEARISWSGKDRAAVVDVDFPEGERPDPVRLEQIVPRLPIQPAYWWISHGGGLKLIFFAIDPFTAEALAEIVVLLLEKALTPAAGFHGATFEIKSDTRHPLYARGEERCSQVYAGGLTDLAAARRKMFHDYPDEELDADKWEEWLDEQGYTIGQRLPHDHCPIDPRPKKDDHVVVNDTGIYCYSCAANSLAYPGLTKPGWTPARLLMDGTPIRPRSPLRLAVKNYVHHEQAQFLVRSPKRYRAMLELCHLYNADNPEFVEAQIRRVFDRYNLLYLSGSWCQLNGILAPEAGKKDLISTLPAVLYPNHKGKAAPDRRILGLLQGCGDLSPLGYVSMIPMRGLDMAEVSRAVQPIPDDKVLAVLPANPPIKLRSVVTEDEMASARKRVEDCYPGIDFDYLLLCLAAKGVVQQSSGIDLPRVVAYGPTGVGKTQTIRLAGVMTGEVVSTPRFQKDEEKFLRAYADASASSSFAAFNDFEKVARRLEPGQLLSYCLHFEPGVQFHRLYAGTRQVDLPAAVFLTCIEIPEEMRQQAEIGRRFVAVEFGGADDKNANWKETSGTNGLEHWLTHDTTGRNKEARDTIVSWVVNKYFSDGDVRTFEAIARDLGFKLLSEETPGRDKELVEFFDLAQAMPENGSGRYKEPGWRVFKVHGDEPIAAAYRALTDGGKDPNRLKAVQWAALLKQPGLRISIRPDPDNDSRVGVRFYHRGNK